MSPLRVLIVSHDQLSRAGLAALLDGQPGVSVVGQAQGGEDIGRLLDVYSPDALVWDVAWDTAESMAALALLPEDPPPVLALSTTESQAAQAKAAGARGLLSRDAGAAAIAAALQALVHGFRVEDPAATGPAPGVASPSPLLTPREMEVLRLLAEGLPNKGLASRLSVSEHTVKFHVNSIMGKLNAQSRTEAVTRATRLGILPL